MSKKKFYAVKKGYKVGVYNTWDECKKQVNGFSGAEYKSFQTLDEAYEYMGVKKDVKVENGDFVKAYVDGSYEHAIREYGSGVVILRNDIVEKTTIATVIIKTILLFLCFLRLFKLPPHIHIIIRH